MTPLRKRMTEHMRLKGYSPRTIKSYVNMVAVYARHVGKSPELTDCEDARAFMVYLLEERAWSSSHLHQAVSALKVLFVQVLGREGCGDKIPRPKRAKTLPAVYSGVSGSSSLLVVVTRNGIKFAGEAV